MVRLKVLTKGKEIEQLYAEGFTLREVANNLGIGCWLVYKYLKKNGIPRRRGGYEKGSHHHSDATKRKISESKMGAKNPNWKGNKASKTAGRFRAKIRYNCPEGKEIHHIDGNPLNNKPENIIFVTRKEHMILDKRMEKLTSSDRDEHGWFQ